MIAPTPEETLAEYHAQKKRLSRALSDALEALDAYQRRAALGTPSGRSRRAS